jgi:hypothetical protein
VSTEGLRSSTTIATIERLELLQEADLGIGSFNRFKK